MSDKNMIVANRIKELREVVGYTIEGIFKNDGNVQGGI